MKNWTKLESVSQLENLIEESKKMPVLIFKHSTSCSISSMAYDRLQRNWKSEDSAKLSPYYLDLINFRQISNQIAEQFGVPHESPQVIMVRDGKAIYDNSHMGISYADLMGRI